MLFNSIDFLVFLPVVFAVYWCAARSVRLQNLVVVVASYVFYGWWDWRFLGLMAFTSAWSYVAGAVELSRADAGKPPSKFVVATSAVVNLGVLGAFKYYDFFIGEAVAFLGSLGFEAHAPSLRVILPVGISFYTFQALSYTIDVYRRQIRPTRDPIAFFAYISFFPQLVAGPIERAVNLLPQFTSPRRFDYAEAVAGCRQALWGFFKKCVVADNCAVLADTFLGGGAGGVDVWIGSLAFAIQIYGDFSGYSDIAIGVSRLFGIRLMRNFAFPYFARDIAEFWRRWHISLTTWFRDYLYIPLGGSRCGTARRIRNTFAIFLVSGLWHGANWTFLVWGAFHAVLFLPLLLLGRNRDNTGVTADGRALPRLVDVWHMARTFFLALIGWTIFRARSIGEAAGWLASMFNPRSFASPAGVPRETAVAAVATVLMLSVEWFNRREEWGFARLPRRTPLRWAVYIAVLWLVVFYAPGSQSFVYFQF
ncbi:MAG: MBOAT family protein [Kiritimatiellae bacterium]|nr:MBOAT family protein [Kiritimatiellia bacterium]